MTRPGRRVMRNSSTCSALHHSQSEITVSAIVLRGAIHVPPRVLVLLAGCFWQWENRPAAAEAVRNVTTRRAFATGTGTGTSASGTVTGRACSVPVHEPHWQAELAAGGTAPGPGPLALRRLFKPEIRAYFKFTQACKFNLNFKFKLFTVASSSSSCSHYY